MEKLTNYEPWLKKDDILKTGFTETEENTYVKYQGRDITLKLKVFPEYNELGINIEFYINDRLSLSGYWLNKLDFNSTFFTYGIELS